MTAKTMTAAALRGALTESGATDAAVEVAIRLTAPARHFARVESAMRAALEHAAIGLEPGAVDAMIEAVMGGKSGADLPRPSCLSPGDCWALAAAAHCAVEAWVGVGGPAGAGGPGRGTARAVWARALGKGRARASDGGAWDAALADASVRLAFAAGAPGGIVTLEPTGEGLRACAPGLFVLLGFDTLAQVYALCVRGLAEALPAEAPHRLDPLGPECNLRFEGSLDEWARTLDYIGESGALECLPDEIPEGDRLRDYVRGVFVPWADRAVAAREESDRRGAAGAPAPSSTADETAHIHAAAIA